MLRFSSSTTSDMNIYQLRAALFNFIVSKQRGESLLVRIEDMDQTNSIKGKDQEILDLLALFKIDYSQVVYQSQNVRFHSAMALQLLHEKRAFSCFCSDDWLDSKREEAQRDKKAYSYDDACRNLPAELVIDNMNPFRIRAIRPDTTKSITDITAQILSFTPDEIDSFTIMNQDKTPSYDFATAVDDMLSDITLVVAQNDDKNATARQEHIRDLLSYNKNLEFVFLNSIKAQKIPTVKELLQEGYLPSAISNYLISTLVEPPREIFNTEDALEWLQMDSLLSSPTLFEIEQLKKINKEHLKNLDAKELSRYVGFADAELGELARTYLQELSTTKELKAKMAAIFAPREIPKELQAESKIITQAIKEAPHFASYEDFKNHILSKTGLESEKSEKILRLLLTNAEDGPEISTIYRYLKNYIGEIIK